MANFSYPYSLIQLIQGNLFYGLPSEDPYAHLATYIDICNTVKTAGVPENATRLNLFSFSLAGKAKIWLRSFKGNSLRTWDEVVEKFLKKYFPESKTIEGKVEISSFHQHPHESLSEALDRFHGLLWKTPTHGFSEPVQLNIFIDGMQPHSKQLLDASAGGKIKLKTHLQYKKKTKKKIQMMKIFPSLLRNFRNTSRKEKLIGVRISIMEENHKRILKSLGVTNATKLVTSRPTVRQMKNGRRKVKRKDLTKEELRKHTLHGMTMIHPMVQKRRLIF